MPICCESFMTTAIQQTNTRDQNNTSPVYYLCDWYTLCTKKVRLAWSWILCTAVSLLQWNLARNIPTALAIKCVHNLLPHLSYVLHYLTLHKNQKVMLSSSQWVARKRTGYIWLEPVSVPSDVPLFLHMHAAMFATGQWLRRWCPEECGPKCQWAYASARQCRISFFV